MAVSVSLTTSASLHASRVASACLHESLYACISCQPGILHELMHKLSWLKAASLHIMHVVCKAAHQKQSRPSRARKGMQQRCWMSLWGRSAWHAFSETRAPKQVSRSLSVSVLGMAAVAKPKHAKHSSAALARPPLILGGLLSSLMKAARTQRW